MGIISALNTSKVILQKSVGDLVEVREKLYNQLYTTVGQFDEEEVYNFTDPYLSDSLLDELEGITDTIEETMRGLEDDLPIRVYDMFNSNSLDEIKDLCDYTGSLRKLSTFKPERIEEDYLEGVHNEELDDAVQRAADAVAEAREELAEKANSDSNSMFENIDMLTKSIQDIINEL